MAPTLRQHDLFIYVITSVENKSPVPSSGVFRNKWIVPDSWVRALSLTLITMTKDDERSVMKRLKQKLRSPFSSKMISSSRNLEVPDAGANFPSSHSTPLVDHVQDIGASASASSPLLDKIQGDLTLETTTRGSTY
jgi:hypothetical protein